MPDSLPSQDVEAVVLNTCPGCHKILGMGSEIGYCQKHRESLKRNVPVEYIPRQAPADDVVAPDERKEGDAPCESTPASELVETPATSNSAPPVTSNDGRGEAADDVVEKVAVLTARPRTLAETLLWSSATDLGDDGIRHIAEQILESLDLLTRCGLAPRGSLTVGDIAQWLIDQDPTATFGEGDDHPGDAIREEFGGPSLTHSAELERLREALYSITSIAETECDCSTVEQINDLAHQALNQDKTSGGDG